MLNLKDITIENLKKGKLIKQLPEFYELKTAIEDSLWHYKCSVFDHTLYVMIELKKLEAKLNKKAKNYLLEIVDTHSKSELLFLAALFHDISKKETLVIEDGVTHCPHHEKLGMKKTRRILERFALSKKEKKRIIELVGYHDIIHEAYDLKSGRKLALEKVKRKYSDIYLDLILLGYADTLGCQIKRNDPDQYKSRVKFLADLLNSFSL